jgi:hypothetical protein
MGVLDSDVMADFSELVKFCRARIAEEIPSDMCGCLDANHVPACTPQPWKDRIHRELAAKRAVLDAYDASVRAHGPGLSRSYLKLVAHQAAVWNDHPDYREDWAPPAAQPLA